MRERYALDTVRRFGAVDNRDLTQVFQNLRRALLEQILLPLAFTDEAGRCYDLMSEVEIGENRGRERSHCWPLRRTNAADVDLQPESGAQGRN